VNFEAIAIGELLSGRNLMGEINRLSRNIFGIDIDFSP
jgi:hypothetical protein